MLTWHHELVQKVNKILQRRRQPFLFYLAEFVLCFPSLNPQQTSEEDDEQHDGGEKVNPGQKKEHPQGRHLNIQTPWASFSHKTRKLRVQRQLFEGQKGADFMTSMWARVRERVSKSSSQKGGWSSESLEEQTLLNAFKVQKTPAFSSTAVYDVTSQRC